MIPDFIRRRPLFYAAIVLSAAIAIQQRFFPPSPPGGDLFYQVRENRALIFLEGKIVSEVEQRETFYGDKKVSFIVKAKEIGEKRSEEAVPVRGRTKVYLTNPSQVLAYGDEVVVRGELTLPKPLRNPGGFDQRATLERQGIRTLFFGAKGSEVKILGHHLGNVFQAKAFRIKRFLSEGISKEFNKRDGAFLKALFLGERSEMDEDFKDLFLKTGTIHILSVSGFNIGFLIFSVLFLLKPFSLSRDMRYFLILLAVWFYCLIVGWQAPVVRASLMASLWIFGKLLGLKTDILNTLGSAALVILIVNPKQLFDLGFQLSFLAVFGIVCFVPLFIRPPELLPNEKLSLKEKVFQYTKELFWVSFMCLLVTLPLTVQNFYIVTPYSLLANMIVVPLSFLIFFSGVLFFCTFWWMPKFLGLVPMAIKLMMRLFVAALFWIENLPGAYFIVGKLHPLFLAILTAGILYFLLDKRIKNNLLRAAALAIFVTNVFLMQDISHRFWRPFRMTVLDVGQGDAIYFEFPNGGNLLVDAGKGGDGDKGRWVIAPFLKSKGVRSIDALTISHPQADHIGGMPAVLDEFEVRYVVDAGSDYGSQLFRLLKSKISKENSRELHAHAGERLEGFKDIQISALNPMDWRVAVGGDPPTQKNINNESLVLKVVYKQTSFLLTGDIEEPAMKRILEANQDIRSTVLKVPHHGAKLKRGGEAFVKEVSPQISVISVGERNPFRHPSAKTLSLLDSIPGNRVFRTDKDYAVELISDGFHIDCQKLRR